MKAEESLPEVKGKEECFTPFPPHTNTSIFSVALIYVSISIILIVAFLSVFETVGTSIIKWIEGFVL